MRKTDPPVGVRVQKPREKVKKVSISKATCAIFRSVLYVQVAERFSGVGETTFTIFLGKVVRGGSDKPQ